MTVFNVINVLLALLGVLGVLCLIVGFPLGIVFLVQAQGEQDPAEKKHKQRLAIWSLAGPFLAVFADILIFVVVRVIQNALQIK
jgi:hypothetical protein